MLEQFKPHIARLVVLCKLLLLLGLGNCCTFLKAMFAQTRVAFSIGVMYVQDDGMHYI